jgi:uncharacterized protein (DUF736 family)
MNTNNNNTKQNDWAKRDVGALWKREGQNQKYLSGYVKVDELGIEKELKIVVFSNKNKNNNEKAPDYRIYLSKPMDKTSAINATETVKTTVSKKVAPTKVKVAEVIEEAEEVEDTLL